MALKDIEKNQDAKVESVFEALARSDFRRRQKLRKPDLRYLKAKGLTAVMRHAVGFIDERLAPAAPPRDGMQTPMKGHPVFTAQHATATCCRRCLASWHRIPAGRPLADEEKVYIAKVLQRWMEVEMKRENLPDDTAQLSLDV